MRKSYTAYFKLKALKYAEIHGTIAAALEYDCLERSIRQWNMKSKLEGCRRTRRAFRGPGARWKELEMSVKSMGDLQKESTQTSLHRHDQKASKDASRGDGPS